MDLHKIQNTKSVFRGNPSRATMADVPLEIIAGILSRLAVRPLLRFRCVSKTWSALIDSPQFINLHLNRSLQTNSHRTIILVGRNLCSIDLDSLESIVQLNHSMKCHSQTDILGYCNGLLCLSNTDQHVFLWNPSTQKYHKLPVSPFEYVDIGSQKKRMRIAYGFGYDDVTQDYKVIRMVQWYVKAHNSFDSQVQIYSMKFNSWRRIADFPYYLISWRASGVLVAGALHWLVSRDVEPDVVGCDLIAAFDIMTEEHWVVPPPEYSDKNFTMRLEVLGGCLCVCCYVKVMTQNIEGIVDIWVMKDYGVRESWTKIISVEQPLVSRYLPDAHISFNPGRPLAYSRSCEQVLLAQGRKRLIWYDLKGRTIQNVSVGGMPEFSEAFFCLESLVQPNCGAESDGKQVARAGEMVEE